MPERPKGGPTLGKAIRYVPKAMYRALKEQMVDVFSEPTKFVIFIFLIIGLVILSSFTTLFIFCTPFMIFLFALWFAKREGRLDRGPRLLTYGVVSILAFIVLTPSIFGYVFYEVSKIDPAEVPKDHLYNTGWRPNTDLDSDLVVYYGLGRLSTRGYEHPSSSDNDYPGTLIIVTVKSLPLVSESTVLDQVNHQIKEFSKEGLNIDLGSEQKGTRTLHDGSRATYIEYDAVVTSDINDDTLRAFKTGAKLKVRGEVWTCSNEQQIVAAAGYAQFGWTFEEGTYSAKLAQIQNLYQDDLGTYTDLKNHIYYVEC